MTLEEYIKIRCDLNNLNYKEVPYLNPAALKEAKISKHTKIIKQVKDEQQNIKYIIAYYLYDYSDLYESESEIEYQFRVNVSATFYIFKGIKQKKMSENSNASYSKEYYDTVSISYNLSDYREPKEIEQIVANFWNSHSSFVNDPYKVVI